MKVNEYKLKITGSLNLSAPLNIDTDYDLTVANLSITACSDISNNDGTINRVFKGVLSELSEVNIIGQKEFITAKKKGSQAKVLRYAIEELADRRGEEREEFYQRQMTKLIQLYKDKE